MLVGLGIGSKPDPLTARTRVHNPIKVIFQKTPCYYLLFAFKYFYYIFNPFCYDLVFGRYREHPDSDLDDSDPLRSWERELPSHG